MVDPDETILIDTAMAREKASDESIDLMGRVALAVCVLCGGDSRLPLLGTEGDVMEITGLSHAEVLDGLAALREQVIEEEV